jgi:hypothetical protein
MAEGVIHSGHDRDANRASAGNLATPFARRQ